MKNNYTHIAMVLDRSGSMNSVWDDVQGGYAQFIKDNKAAPGECTFTLAAFDDEYLLLEDFTDIQDVSETISVNPRSMTALYDAIGKTVVSVGERLSKMNEKDRPEKVLIQIQTDGFENASEEWTREKVKELVKEQIEKYNWDFQFVGADQKAVLDARELGIDIKNTATYNALNTRGTIEKLSQKTMLYRAAPVDSKGQTLVFSEKDREEIDADE